MVKSFQTKKRSSSLGSLITQAGTEKFSPQNLSAFKSKPSFQAVMNAPESQGTGGRTEQIG
jgi:hypothetical protein